MRALPLLLLVLVLPGCALRPPATTVSSPAGGCIPIPLSLERSRPGDLGHDENASAFLVVGVPAPWGVDNLTYNATWTDPATGEARQASGPLAGVAPAGSRPVAFEDRAGPEGNLDVGDRIVVYGRDADVSLWNETGVRVGGSFRCL